MIGIGTPSSQSRIPRPMIVSSSSSRLWRRPLERPAQEAYKCGPVIDANASQSLYPVLQSCRSSVPPLRFLWGTRSGLDPCE